MAKVLRYFSSPEFLKTVSRQALVRLLRPFGDFLFQNDISLPETETAFTPDYDQLAGLFAAADDGLPYDLAEALFLIDGLATTDGMDKLLQALPDLEPPWNEFTPADVALLAWLQDRETVECVFTEMQVRCRSRSFVSFQSRQCPLPAWCVTDELTAGLESEIDQQFRNRGRGEGTRVIPVRRDDETWFLIRHGEPMRREGCIQNGKSASVFFRPERFDAVVLESVAIAVSDTVVSCSHNFCRFVMPSRLRKNTVNHLTSIDELHGTALSVINKTVRVDSERMKSCGG